MTYLVRCPNCGHRAPWELREVKVEVWCAHCCAYDYDVTHPTWVYNFVVLPRPQSRPTIRPDETTRMYGGWSLRCA